MRYFKRNKTWWADFSVNGQRFRVTLETTDRRAAVGVANKKLTQAEQGKLSPASQNFARLAFSEAAEKYLATRKLELVKSSLAKESQLLVKLKEFFATNRLNRICVEQVLSYREWRARQDCGPAIINMEIGVLRRILKRAKLWHTIADDIKPLKEPPTVGRVLSPSEESSLLATATRKPEWETAYFAAILALNSTMRGCEIRGLRWADVDLDANTLTIRKSKTDAGLRVIPLTDAAVDVLLRLRRRSEMFGPVEAAHYIFASFKPVGRFNGREVIGSRITEFDPTTPIGSWKKAWRKLTKEAGLSGLRFHDLRHHAITELLTNPNISIQTTKSIAGHVSQRMVDRYAHIRLDAKRKALESLSRKGAQVKGNGTNDGTKATWRGREIQKVPINLVGACGFEPQTPTVSR